MQNYKNELDVISSHLPVMKEGLDALVAQETTVHLELKGKKEMLEKVEKEVNKLKSRMEDVCGRKEKLFETFFKPRNFSGLLKSRVLPDPKFLRDQDQKQISGNANIRQTSYPAHPL